MYGGRPCDKEQGSKQEEKCNQDSCIGKTYSITKLHVYSLNIIL